MSCKLTITPWNCPLCVGGLIGIDEKCLHCAGTGLTDDPMGHAERAPRPPGVMRTACADCALRRGSPELENAGANLPDEEPFYCHQGVPTSAAGAYTPTAYFNGLPLGLMVCAGWWAMRTGEPLPAKEYREIGISPEEVEKRWGGVARALEDGSLSDQQVEAIIATHLPLTNGQQPSPEIADMLSYFARTLPRVLDGSERGGEQR